jgi:valyl-tRNA synthetase
MARFVEPTWKAGAGLSGSADGLALADRWIVARLNQTIALVTSMIDDYEFGQAGTLINEFLWGDYADWYIEAAKVILTGGEPPAQAAVRGVLVHVLDQACGCCTRSCHSSPRPCWQALPHPDGEAPALIVARWPEAAPVDEQRWTSSATCRKSCAPSATPAPKTRSSKAGRVPATIVAGSQYRLAQPAAPTSAGTGAAGRSAHSHRVPLCPRSRARPSRW